LKQPEPLVVRVRGDRENQRVQVTIPWLDYNFK